MAIRNVRKPAKKPDNLTELEIELAVKVSGLKREIKQLKKDLINEKKLGRDIFEQEQRKK